jgi:hypothetical protein
MRDSTAQADVVDAEHTHRYLIVVPASDLALYRYLEARFEGDAQTRLILDRRRRIGAADGSTDPPEVERRVSRTTPLFSLGVTVIRLTDGSPAQEIPAHHLAGRRTRVTMDGLEDRQRVDRWLEESQYLIGRMIPAYLDDRDRARARVESVEQDNERLRNDLADARREIAELRGDLEFHRGERTRIAENFHTIIEHLTALQGPVNDISSRLHSSPQLGTEVSA